jgi:hypothetical protein
MPRHYTFPDLLDECKTLSISKFREWGYLEPGTFKSGVVHWSRNEQRYASIGVLIDTFADRPYLELDYKCNGEPIKYKVYLTSVSSNIGRGKVWYFLCPNTGKRCRKLYMINTYFLHRTAFKGAMYEKQTYSKHSRDQIRAWGKLFCTDNVYDQIYSKHFKTFYKGQPTKRYLKLWKKLRKAGEVSDKDLIDYLRG